MDDNEFQALVAEYIHELTLYVRDLRLALERRAVEFQQDRCNICNAAYGEAHHRFCDGGANKE